jgi:TolA-binding protein
VGDFASAADTLRDFLKRHPRDRRAALAWFTLGKVELARDRATSAAAAFRQCFSQARDATLVEDAIAEEAAAWQAAGNLAEAQAVAQQYVGQFPQGAHIARMRRILQLE